MQQERQQNNPDRVPPQDIKAEQSVLGAMMMSKDAIANVVEVVKGRDFYRPAHELIYDAILDGDGRTFTEVKAERLGDASDAKPPSDTAARPARKRKTAA